MKIHPKRGLLLDKSVHEMCSKVSTLVTYYVHEISATQNLLSCQVIFVNMYYVMTIASLICTHLFSSYHSEKNLGRSN